MLKVTPDAAKYSLNRLYTYSVKTIARDRVGLFMLVAGESKNSNLPFYDGCW